MAVAPHALAAQSALAVLRESGNAVEAMIAAAAGICSFCRTVGMPFRPTGLRMTA